LLRPFIGATQASGVDSIPAAFDRYRASHVQEKIYAHIDRTSYLAGEILWFKIYNLDAVCHRPLDLSSVAYVEVLDMESKAVVQAKVSLNKGTGNGSVYLPISLASGEYRFRVYTRWMRNFSPEFYFEENIRIINTLNEQAKTTRLKEKSYDVQFFPEGGDLVLGVKSKVAFRATDESGKGVDFKGTVQDDANRVVSELLPGRFGIGSFLLTPTSGMSYRAVIQFADGTITTYRLPLAKQKGYRLAITEIGDQVVVDIASGQSDATSLYLFTHSSNKVEFASKVSLINGYAEVFLPKNKLHNGISHFTLFDSEYRPVSERLWFKRGAAELQVEALADNQEYERRKKVVVDIRTMLIGSAPVSADLSVSVFNADSLQTGKHTGIDNYLLLSSELKGTIEEPDFYFSGDPEASSALDNLMLTHGWRRFNWDELLSPSPFKPRFIPEASYHIVPARVTSAETKRPVNGVRSYLSVPGASILFYSGMSNADGRVDFYTKGLNGVQPLVLQTNSADTALYSIDLISPFSDEYSGRGLTSLSLSSMPMNTLLINSINMQALNIFLKDRLNRFVNSSTDSIPFFGHAKEKYLLDDFTRFPTVEEVLREYVLSVGVRRRNGKPTMHVYTGEVNKGFFEEPPLVLMDGVPMFDRTKFFNYEPLKIKSIEVLPKKYFYGQDVYGGLIRFSTYKANLDGMELDPGATIIDYEGLQQVREFYSPRYDTPDQRNSRLPDFRNLLFWKPDVETDNDGRAQLSFYTSDRPGTYRGVIQGITNQGQAGKYTFDFQVK
jgi:hypothetical protein